MLHIAPERCLSSLFINILGEKYLSADLYNTSAMIKMDICEIEYPDNHFSSIYCSHVLEHIIDDKKAIKELYRVLCNGGWAILNVPIKGELTDEDENVITKEDRLRIYGHEEHVRSYGRDYIFRLQNAGFNVEIIKVENIANEEITKKMGLTAASGDIYFCTKCV
jgi:ubiquinone/menaquinone biosynthesis C-methylase UbiE